jgi:hypothetical protein
LAVIGLHQYVYNDLSRHNWKNYWMVDGAEVIEWRPGYVNVKLYAHGHKYRVLTRDGRAVVIHIVAKRTPPPIVVRPVPWYVRLWRRIVNNGDR